MIGIWINAAILIGIDQHWAMIQGVLMDVFVYQSLPCIQLCHKLILVCSEDPCLNYKAGGSAYLYRHEPVLKAEVT